VVWSSGVAIKFEKGTLIEPFLKIDKARMTSCNHKKQYYGPDFRSTNSHRSTKSDTAHSPLFRFSQGLAKSETAHSPLFSIFAGTCEIRNCTFSCFVLVPNYQPRTLGPRFKLMANSVQF
jgi:hypothetical protein